MLAHDRSSPRPQLATLGVAVSLHSAMHPHRARCRRLSTLGVAALQRSASHTVYLLAAKTCTFICIGVLRGACAMHVIAVSPYGAARGTAAHMHMRLHVALPHAHATRCLTHVRRADTAPGACRARRAPIAVQRHVPHAARSGWRCEPRVCVVRAQVIDYPSHAHGALGALLQTRLGARWGRAAPCHCIARLKQERHMLNPSRQPASRRCEGKL